MVTTREFSNHRLRLHLDSNTTLSNVMAQFEDYNYSYEELENALDELEPLGFTFDYGLDADPYNFRKINVAREDVSPYPNNSPAENQLLYENL